MKSLFHILIPFLSAARSEDSSQFNSSAPKLISWQAGVSKLDSSLPTPVLFCLTLPYNHFPRNSLKTASIVKEAYLRTRCLAVDILLLRALACAGMCLPSRCLARHNTSFRALWGIELHCSTLWSSPVSDSGTYSRILFFCFRWRWNVILTSWWFPFKANRLREINFTARCDALT
jgi:hypothetical protein